MEAAHFRFYQKHADIFAVEAFASDPDEIDPANPSVGSEWMTRPRRYVHWFVGIGGIRRIMTTDVTYPQIMQELVASAGYRPITAVAAGLQDPELYEYAYQLLTTISTAPAPIRQYFTANVVHVPGFHFYRKQHIYYAVELFPQAGNSRLIHLSSAHGVAVETFPVTMPHQQLIKEGYELVTQATVEEHDPLLVAYILGIQ